MENFATKNFFMTSTPLVETLACLGPYHFKYFKGCLSQWLSAILEYLDPNDAMALHCENQFLTKSRLQQR